MKKVLLIALLSCLAVVSVRADVIWTENFAYDNGVVTNVSGGLWVKYSGSGTDGLGDMFVNNNQLEVAATISGTSTTPLSRQDDDYRRLCTSADCPYTNGLQILYASLTVTCTNLPNGAGSYFASFYSTNNGGYFARLCAQTNGTVVPNTWRLGVTTHQSTATNIYPADLALNTAYQAVMLWDPVTLYATRLWVNPLGESDAHVTASDFPAISSTNIVDSFAFRQAGTFASAFFQISKLVVATTFDDASPAPSYTSPSFVIQPQNTTNYTGTRISLGAVANGQNLAALAYQWQKADSSSPGTFTNIPVSVQSSATSNVLTIAGAALTDTAQYQVIVTQPVSSLSATSSPAWLVVQNIPGPPNICGQPVATNSVYFGQTVNLSVCVNGTPPVSGKWGTWYYNGSVIDGVTVGTNDVVSTDGTALTINNVQPDNGTAGTYYCHLVGFYGSYYTNSSNAYVISLPPVATNISYLRGLVDPVYYVLTNTTTYFQVTGTVTSKTNYSAGAVNVAFFIQDDTGGIEVYWYNPGGAPPQLGDNVTVTGPLSSYQSMMEISPAFDIPGTGVITNSSGNPIPPGQVLPLTFTNSAAYGGISNALRSFTGSLITFTNVHFPAADGTATFAGNYTYVMADEQGNTFPLYIYYGFTSLVGMVIPTGNVWRVTAPMGVYESQTAADRSAGYQFEPSMPEDIVTTAPLPVNVAISVNGSGKPVLTWTAEPFMSYTVLRSAVLSTNIADYQAVASGLTFNTTSGQYTDQSATPGETWFYKVASP
jgi:hypothetical protein